MAELSPAGVNIAVLAVAVVLYGIIWFATRGLSRFAKVLARLSPLGLLIPALLYVSMLTKPGREAAAPRPEAVETTVDDRDARRSPKKASRPPGPDSERSAEAPPPPRVGMAPPPPPASPPPPEPAPQPPLFGGAPPPPAAGPPGEPPSAARRMQPTPRPPAKSEETPKEDAAKGPPPGVPAQPQSDWDVVPVFYGTDRMRKDEPKRPIYTSDRARRLELGRALVTVPKLHQVPNIERPFAIRIPYFQITLYERAEDPKQHFTVQEMKVLTREQFRGLVRERVGGSNSYKDQAVVFVHGYNTSFDDALYRTAQMAYDLKFDGASFLYSWPSVGDFTGYGYDRESSSQAEPYLRDFLELVLKDSGAKSVSVIAHSMGNLPLLRVLQSLGPSLPPDVRLNQIILAAPDVDRDVFTYLAANIKSYGRGITLYCSSNDRAMEAARRVAGRVPRAGDVPTDGPIVLSGIDTIDITQTSTDYLALNHSTYAEKSALLNDIGLLLQTGERPPDRRIPILQRINTAAGDFWRYPMSR